MCVCVCACACVCIHLLVASASPLLTVSPTRPRTYLLASPLYQQHLAHGLGYRRNIMNILVNSKDVFCSTLSYNGGHLESSSSYSFGIAGSLGHLCFLSNERDAAGWSASSHRQPGRFWAVLMLDCPRLWHPIYIKITAPQPALQLKQARGYCYWGQLPRACRAAANDFR